MGAPLFDVFVVGPADGSGGSLPSLNLVLATRLGISQEEVTSGLAARRLLAAQRIDQAGAQALVKELKGMGVAAVIRPAAAVISPPPRPVAPPPPQAFSPPPSSTRDLFAPPPSAGAIDLLTGLPPPHPTNLPDTSGARMVAALGKEPSLELATTEIRRAPAAAAGSSGLNSPRVAASSSASGLAIDSEVASEAYRVRCAHHGLFYDTRKASGCGKCLAPGRKLSAQLADKQRQFKLAEFDEDDAAKRAFIGLAIALVVGFIPAAYHALRVGARDLRAVRAEQELLSRKPATEEISRRFEELNDVVKASKSRAVRTTAVLWVVVTAGAMVGWYKLT
jgi:hypothetical protein